MEEHTELLQHAISVSGHIRAGQGKVLVICKSEPGVVERLSGILLTTEVANRNELMKGQRTGVCAIVDPGDYWQDISAGDLWLHIVNAPYTGWNHADFEWIPEGYEIRCYGNYAPVSDCLVSPI